MNFTASIINAGWIIAYTDSGGKKIAGKCGENFRDVPDIMKENGVNICLFRKGLKMMRKKSL